MKESILRKGSQATGFKLLFLALTLLSFNGLTANRSVLTWIAYAVTAIGIAVLVIRVVCFKNTYMQKAYSCLLHFAEAMRCRHCLQGSTGCRKRKGTRLDGVPVFYTVHL